MFTGLIEEVGRVHRTGREGRVARLAINGRQSLADLEIGGSIAVDGTCLTATVVGDGLFEVDLSDETLGRTTLGDLRPGDPVNLERPCRPSDRLGGHIVTGHVDGVGIIRSIRRIGVGWWFSFSFPEALGSLLVEKGSIAVDGISLTVASLHAASFEAAIVPHTYLHTTLGSKHAGCRVNLETDLVGKYVIRYLEGLGVPGKGPGVTEAYLRELGYA